MLTCSWSGSTAPGAKRISAVISPVERSNSSVFASQPGKRVFCHSMLCGRTTWECVSAVSCLALRRHGVHGDAPLPIEPWRS